MELFGLLYFCMSLVSPHATLLYWLSNTGYSYGLQYMLNKPSVAKSLRLPMLVVQTSSSTDLADKQSIEQEQVMHVHYSIPCVWLVFAKAIGAGAIPSQCMPPHPYSQSPSQ